MKIKVLINRHKAEIRFSPPWEGQGCVILNFSNCQTLIWQGFFALFGQTNLNKETAP